jgi:DNA-binding NtrC family response regulator
VDDDKPLLRSLQRGLKDAHRVTLAASIDEAIEAIANLGPFAAIISDVDIAGENGSVWLPTVPDVESGRTRGLIISGLDDSRGLERRAAGDGIGFVAKSDQDRSLLSALRSFLIRVSLGPALADALDDYVDDCEGTKEEKKLLVHAPWIRSGLIYLAVGKPKKTIEKQISTFLKKTPHGHLKDLVVDVFAHAWYWHIERERKKRRSGG